MKEKGSPDRLKEQAAVYRAKPQDGPSLYSWRRAVGLNRETFARLANFSERSLATYEKEEVFPPSVKPQLNEAMRLVKALLEIIPAEDLQAWLEAPNTGFGGRRPWTLIEEGEKDLLWEMIYQVRQGVFG